MSIKKTLILIGITFFLVNYSCQFKDNKYNVDNSIFNVNIKEGLKSNESIFLLTDIAKEIKYIPLETSNDCLIRFPHNVVITDDYLFVSDRRALHQFYLNGKHVRQVGSIGKGPGEYIGIISFATDPANNEVSVYCKYKVNVYDLVSGEFKISYGMQSDVFDFYVHSRNSKVFLTYEIPNNLSGYGINEVYITDLKGNILDSIPNNLRKNILSNSSGFPISYKNESGIFYLYNYGDTLFKIDNFQRIPYAIFNLENTINRNRLNIDFDSDKIQFPDFISFAFFLEFNDYFFITIQEGLLMGPNSAMKRFIYFKNNHTLISLAGINNNIDNGPEFWPRRISNEYLISSYQAYEIIDYFNETKGKFNHGADFIKIVESLKEDDNPILVLVK